MVCQTIVTLKSFTAFEVPEPRSSTTSDAIEVKVLAHAASLIPKTTKSIFLPSVSLVASPRLRPYKVKDEVPFFIEPEEGPTVRT